VLQPIKGDRKMRKSLKAVLIERDGLTENEAQESIQEAYSEAMELIEAGDFTEAMDICETYFGLEPDYLADLGLV
jgi:hypothetical protein